MIRERAKSALANTAPALLFLALVAAAWVSHFARTVMPPVRPQSGGTAAIPSRETLFAAMSPEAVCRAYGEIVGFGSRAPGQPGLELTADWLLAHFRALGMETYEQEVEIAHPLLVGGGVVSNAAFSVAAWPLSPNYAQPSTTGPDGVEGELFLANAASMRECADFEGKIAVIDLGGEVFGDFGLNPARYAAMGFSAVAYTHSGGLAAANWGRLGGEACLRGLPVNIVRIACEPEILEHCGEKARIDAASAWRPVTARNVVGVLHAPEHTGRALFIAAQYDATSFLPDFASGSLEAYQTAILAQAAEALSSVRDSLRRDVVFVATVGMPQNHSGANRLLSTVGCMDSRGRPAQRLDEDVERNEERLAMICEIEEALASVGDIGRLPEAIRRLPGRTQKFLAERFSVALRDLLFAQSESLLRAGIAYHRNPGDLDSEAYRVFRREKALYDSINTLSGLPLTKAARNDLGCIVSVRPELGRSDDNGDAISGNPAVALLRESLARLRAYHLRRRASLQADARLVSLFSGYNDICAMASRISPSAVSGAPERPGIASGRDIADGEAMSMFRTLAIKSLARAFGGDAPELGEGGLEAYSGIFDEDLDSLPFCAASFPAFSLVTAAAPPRVSRHPYPQPEFADPSLAPAGTLRAFADLAAEIAGSDTSFPRLPARLPLAARGSVYAAGIGNSVLPNYPVPGAFICSMDRKQSLFTDPYGEYDVPFTLLPLNEAERWVRYDAFFFDEWGRVTYAKDYGTAAQSLYASKDMVFNYQPMNHVLYRAAPVAVLDIVNPQSLKAFSSCAFIGAKSLNGFQSVCGFASGDGFMDFIPPNERFFVTLKSGAPENELVAVTREFCLGTARGDDPAFTPTGAEIEGPGYLAADTPILIRVVPEAIASMAWLTGKRLALQRRYGLADELTEAFARKATADDGGPSTPSLARLRRQRESLSYLILNHPDIRKSMSEAVFGIIWYLGLLVPFAFFFEKLLFGFADPRKQSTAQLVIFIAVFTLLHQLHPAFHIIRSSVMILLGFMIVIVVGVVLALLSGKFQENIDALRRRQGHVARAEANRGGVIMTAFMLGLNNMHRRRIRTGLTCATLVLMTFVMVCFTSVQSNVVDSERAVGSATYQGMVLRNRDFAPLAASEIDALKSEFGERHAVSRRTLYTGWYDQHSMLVKPAAFKVMSGSGADSRRRTARGAIGFDATEPLAPSIRLLATNGWFSAATSGFAPPVMLPDRMAAQLGITPALVETGLASVTINDVTFAVHNIFDSESLAAATDIDGHDLLPFDAESLAATRFGPGNVLLADDATPRVPSDEVILVLNNTLRSDGRGLRTASAAIDMGGATFPEARAQIVSHMERTGRECRYALGGTAFTGQIARNRSASGYIELLIPLVIAALTVLNTMKGSVYERQGEIYVYNAVGISPGNIFFIFMAESLVYAVVGSVLGYILALGAGRIVMANGTGGVALNFTSATCVYASLAIGAVTLLSTWFPARTAMRIAKPSDDSGWRLPQPDSDDRMSIMLPFTFTARDRIAVLAFFQRYFEGYGEGGSGPFFASDPVLKLADHLDDLAGGAYIPALEVTVWLKPFDLGVSQRLQIELATDPDTREFIAKMILTRLTGTRDAWLRLNGPMVTAVRRRFLHWRAVSDEQKEEFFAQASAELRKKYRQPSIAFDSLR